MRFVDPRRAVFSEFNAGPVLVQIYRYDKMPRDTYIKEGGVMKIPEYITKAEVTKFCKELKIRDWAKLKTAKVLPKEAKAILDAVNETKMNIDPEEFRKGLEVELEHGVRFKDANVTNNHPLITGKIVITHLKESLDYYKLLEVAELEGDLHKAILAGDMKKVKKEYKKLALAKMILEKTVAAQVK